MIYAVILWSVVPRFSSGQNPYFSKVDTIGSFADYLIDAVPAGDQFIASRISRDLATSELNTYLVRFDSNGTELNQQLCSHSNLGEYVVFPEGQTLLDSIYIQKGHLTFDLDTIPNGIINTYNLNDGSFNWGYIDSAFGSSGFLSLCYYQGFFYCVGYQFDGSSTNWYLVKLNSSGQFIERHVYPSFGYSSCYHIVEYDGYLYMSGVEVNDGNGDDNEEALLIKIDTNGNIIWKSYFDYSPGSFSRDLDEIRVSVINDKLIGMGRYNKHDDPKYYGIIVSYDTAGLITDTLTFDLPTDLWGITSTTLLKEKDTTFITAFTSYKKTPSFSDAAAYLREFSMDLVPLWERKFEPRNTQNVITNLFINDGYRVLLSGAVSAESAAVTQDGWLGYLSCLGYDTLPRSNFTYLADSQTVYFNNTGAYANEYIWDFGDGDSLYQYSDPSIISPEMPFISHEYKSWGEFQVTLTSIACNDTTKKTQNIVVPRDHFEENSFHIYPNPFTEEVFLQFSEVDTVNNGELHIYDNIGKLVFEESYRGSELAYGVNIDLQFLSEGLYYFRLESGDRIKVMKMIKESF